MIPCSCWTMALAALTITLAVQANANEYENMMMHCKGEGITDLMQWDHVQCAAYCDVRDDCYGYVFNMKDNFTCILKGKTCVMAPSEVWRFYKKPGAAAERANENSNWNADPAESSSHDETSHAMGGDDVVHGPPGNQGNSFTKRDFHCAGKNMGDGQPWSLSECAAQCLRNDKCIGFIRLITGDQNCILKESGCTKKPPTVWVFYEKTDGGEVYPDGSSAESVPEVAAASQPVSADAVGGYGMVSPNGDDHFSDTHQHCKGGVISNEMRGHDQCSRACLDAPDCIGYSIGTKEPFQCYLKSKECELSGHHPMWTFIKKNDQASSASAATSSSSSSSSNAQSTSEYASVVDSQHVIHALSPSLSSEDLFREMRAVRCIKFAEEYGASTSDQCKQMCLERETFCVGVSYRSGSCKLITSFDCGGWQIFKKLAEDQAAAAGQALQHPWQAAGVPETASPSMIDLSPSDHGGDHMHAGGELNDPIDNQDILLYFHKLNGNCRGGRMIEEVYGTEADCASKCHEDARCRGFSYIKADQRCSLKADNCREPNVLNPGVAFWIHLQRQ